MSYEARIIDLGTREFGEVWALQRELVAARQKDEIPDTLLFVEHPHVITAGRSAHRENLLVTDELPIFEIERGGDVTYHGPGQLVGYPIFLLRENERDLHVYLRNLEEAIIRALAHFDLRGERKPEWTGVWTAGGARKLASIGVAVKRWVTLHGFALNVSTDLSRFSAINPCGLDAAVMGSMAGELAHPVAIEAVKSALRDTFVEVFGRTFA
ncbi:MAG TPA: lipoyl(octanoyl) transferase LipB [Polyangia bacterium]